MDMMEGGMGWEVSTVDEFIFSVVFAGSRLWQVLIFSSSLLLLLIFCSCFLSLRLVLLCLSRLNDTVILMPLGNV